MNISYLIMAYVNEKYKSLVKSSEDPLLKFAIKTSDPEPPKQISEREARYLRRLEQKEKTMTDEEVKKSTIQNNKESKLTNKKSVKDHDPKNSNHLKPPINAQKQKEKTPEGGKRYLRQTIEKLEKYLNLKHSEGSKPSTSQQSKDSSYDPKEYHQYEKETKTKTPRIVQPEFKKPPLTAKNNKSPPIVFQKPQPLSKSKSPKPKPLITNIKETKVVKKTKVEIKENTDDSSTEKTIKISKIEKTESISKTVKLPTPQIKSGKKKTPFKEYPPLTLFYWNPNSLGATSNISAPQKRGLIESEDCHMIFLCEPYHHYELPGFITASGRPLDKKTKIYSQILWREELPIELVLADVDLIVVKMNVSHLTNPLYFFCVYLSHTDERRLTCLSLIEETLKEANRNHTGEDKPLVIMVGDFNRNLMNINSYSRDLTDKALNVLLKQMNYALDMKHNEITRERAVLGGKRYERSRIDWLLMSKYGLKIQSRVVKESMEYSDHFAFVFNVTM